MCYQYISSVECEGMTCNNAVQENKAYYTLRLERANAKHVGLRAKRAAEAAAEEKDKAK